MDFHKHLLLHPTWLFGVLMLFNTAAVQAVTPACGTNLTSDTTLDSDLNCAITALVLNGIDSNNINLDCAGFSVTTTNRGSPGVLAQNTTGVTIENCNIVTSGTTAFGIGLFDTSNSLISNNTINTSNTFSLGVQLIRSSGNTIDGNTISSTGLSSYAIHIASQSSTNTVSDNILFSNFTRGILIRGGSNNNTLLQNTIESSSSHSVEIHSSSDNLIDTNTFISPTSFVRIQNAWLQNGGLSIDAAGNIFGVENNFGSSGGSGGEVATLYQVDPNTGSTLSTLRLTSGGGIELGFGFDSLEIMSDGRFLAFRGGNNSSLYEINTVTGEITSIPLTLPSLNGGLNGLQATGASTLLATTNQGELVSIDLTAGTASLIGQDGDGWSDLAMHPTSGRLFTMSRWSLEPSGTSHLYEIDPLTGDIIQEIGDTGQAFLSDIDFSPSGVLYSNNGLGEIDTTTGIGTYIGGFDPDPFEQSSANNMLVNQTFTATTDASVQFLAPIALPPLLELSLDEEAIQIGQNSIFVDSAQFPFLNVPARITFENLGGASRILLVDFEDDGTFETCDPPQCSLVSFTGGTLIFDVSGFTTYSSMVPLVTEVEIDIKPFRSSNKIFPRFGLIPVAILGSENFDVKEIDASTLKFGPDGATPFHRFMKRKDINRDGFSDLVVIFRASQSGIQCGDTEATLSGNAASGSFTGTDSITTLFCRRHNRRGWK